MRRSDSRTFQSVMRPRRAVTVGVNRYVEGHDLMWQLNFIDKQADNPAGDAQTVAVGITAHI